MTTAPETATPEAPEPQPDTASAQEQLTLLNAAHEWFLSLRVALARAVDITVLEARLAALNFALILIVAVASGLLLATAWIALFAAIIVWLHAFGLPWSAALLLIAAINLILAVAGGYAIYRMSNNLLFKAIRKFIMYGQHARNGQLSTHGEQDAAAGSAGNAPPAP